LRDVAAEMGLPGKRCLDCLNECDVSAWPLEFFDYMPRGECAKAARSKDPNFKPCIHEGCYSARCTGHSLSARTARDPFERKVHDSFRRHAAQDGITLAQLLMRWNTTVKEKAAWMRERYETGRCPREKFGCGRRWTSMPNGPRDMTFDRTDPDKLFLPHNVDLLCITCQLAKLNMPPERFAIRHRCWHIYDELPKVPKLSDRMLRALGMRRRRRSEPPPPPPSLLDDDVA
jgi:hypothetical protein